MVAGVAASDISSTIAAVPDDELIARILAGDGGAFELLMRRHNQRLFRVARSVVRNEHDAEDIVQEAYIRAFTHLHRFEGRSSVATWLTRIAFREALRRRRRMRNVQPLEEDSLDLRRAAPVESADPAERAASREFVDLHECPVPHEYSPAPESVSPGPSKTADSRSPLVRAVDALPLGLRTVVMLRLVEGLSTRETARSLRLTESNVKVRLHRARQLLAAALRGSTAPDLSREFAFAADRCDRIVAGVLRRLGKA